MLTSTVYPGDTHNRITWTQHQRRHHSLGFLCRQKTGRGHNAKFYLSELILVCETENNLCLTKWLTPKPKTDKINFRMWKKTQWPGVSTDFVHLFLCPIISISLSTVENEDQLVSSSLCCSSLKDAPQGRKNTGNCACKKQKLILVNPIPDILDHDTKIKLLNLQSLNCIWACLMNVWNTKQIYCWHCLAERKDNHVFLSFSPSPPLLHIK